MIKYRSLEKIRQNKALILWIYLMIFSYFIVVPVGMITTVTTTDFRLYDLVFFIGLLFFIVPNFKKVVQVIKGNKWLNAYFQFALFILFTLPIVILLRGAGSAVIASARIFRFLMYGLVAVMITGFIEDQKHIRKALGWFFSLSVLESWLSLLQQLKIVGDLFPERWNYYGSLPVGTLGPHHLHMGMVCAMALAIGLSFLLSEMNIVKKLILSISLVSLTFATIFVKSRTGWVSILLILFYFLIRLIFNPGRVRIFSVIVSTFFISAGFFLFLSISGEDAYQFSENVVESRLIDPYEASGLAGLSGTRVRLVSEIPQMIAKHPWVIVIGSGAQNTSYILSGANAAHNNYLHVFIEGGLVGLFLYLRMLYRIWSQSKKYEAIQPPEFYPIYLTGFQAAFLAILFANFFNEAFYMQYATFSLSGQIMVLIALCLHPSWQAAVS